jgi:two-component system chemotaxis response regulator CheB
MADGQASPPEVFAVGASAGGVEALTRFVSALPGDLSACVLVVLHVAPAGPSLLPQILTRSGSLPATAAQDGDALTPGRILVAPPDHHLLVDDGHVRVDRSPRENGHRPAADPTFRSVADAYGPRGGGIVLSGARDDGSAGLRAIKLAGGWALVQDPETALYPSMPSHAIAATDVDAVLAPAQLATLVARLAHGHLPGSETDRVKDASPVNGQLGPPDDGHVQQICPDCGGVLSEHVDGPLTRFVCHVGHRYSLEGLIEEQAAGVEHALWSAVRILRERSELLQRLGERMRSLGHERAAGSFLDQARNHDHQAESVASAVESLRPVGQSVMS